MAIDEIKAALAAEKEPARAEKHYSFFRAYPGGYGEGDQFIGVRVPAQRRIAKKYSDSIDLKEIEKLLQSAYHEHRLTALFLLQHKFEKASAHTDEAQKLGIVELYLHNLSCVNNWDLVDSSADKILGAYLFEKLGSAQAEAAPLGFYSSSSEILYQLADSGDLWKQRVSIIASFYFIREGRFGETLALADKLMSHPHDLIHKALGWMLREVGKRDFQAEYDFLETRYTSMPRTMLRYAIEKFDSSLRKRFLRGEITPSKVN